MYFLSVKKSKSWGGSRWEDKRKMDLTGKGECLEVGSCERVLIAGLHKEYEYPDKLLKGSTPQSQYGLAVL
jgi:hypothetical protein